MEGRHLAPQVAMGAAQHSYPPSECSAGHSHGHQGTAGPGLLGRGGLLGRKGGQVKELLYTGHHV